MKHLLFTVHDVKAEIFLPPFFVPTIGIATRAFKDCVNSAEHVFGKHPADYTLFSLGSFDDQDATIDWESKKSLGNGVEFIDSNHVHTVKEFRDAAHTSIQPDENSGDPS